MDTKVTQGFLLKVPEDWWQWLWWYVRLCFYLGSQIMSDQERWGSQYPQFISVQPNSVTFEKSNRRQKRGQQWRRQTVQGLTSHWGRTDEGKGRGRTYWRARGVLQIEAVIQNGQSLRSQHWDRRGGEREHPDSEVRTVGGRTVPWSITDDSRNRSLEIVSVHWSCTPSPPSPRTISITVSTSQSRCEWPQ